MFYTVQLIVEGAIQPSKRLYQVVVQVLPANSNAGTLIKTTNVHLSIFGIPLTLKQSILDDLRSKYHGKIETFFDRDKVLKTLLNFGNDLQLPIVNYKLDPEDQNSLLIKLYRPIPDSIAPGTNTFISRELSYPYIDQIFVVDAPELGNGLYLRPANKISYRLEQGTRSVVGATLENLFSTGSLDAVTPRDQTLERWFTTDLEESELNVDYSNYFNFVFYSSAVKRLDAFVQKLTLIEDLNRVLALNSSSLALTGSGNITSSLAYPAIYNIAQNKQDVIRSFDGYERFLYYDSSTPFSGTFVPEHRRDDYDKWYHHTDATWPKTNGAIDPITSSSAWMEEQYTIAEEYDEWNVNRIVNNIPEYLKSDPNSNDFIKFLDMVGHQFDLLKLYVDQMPLIYDRSNAINQGLSTDLIWDVAKSFGISLPNEYAMQSMLQYTIPSGSNLSYREAAAETWKRFLHNQVFMMKTKGTKTSLNTLLNSYGLSPTAISIRESSIPSLIYATESFELLTEKTNALYFSSSYITIPWSSSVGNQPKTVQLRFSTPHITSSMVLLGTGSTWAITLNSAATGSFYSVALNRAGVKTISSSYFEMATDKFTNVMVRHNATGMELFVNAVNDFGVIEQSFYGQETGSTGVAPVWTASLQTFLGGTTSSLAGRFNGNIDEFRVWGELVSQSAFENWSRYPGIYYGNTTSSAATTLWARLSFNKPQNFGGALPADRLAENESPYQWLSTAPANMAFFSASNFENSSSYPYSTRLFERIINRITPVLGSQFDNNKIKIINTPDIRYVSGTTIPVLNKDTSIISSIEKNDDFVKSNNLIGFYVSPTDAINDSIIRSIGVVNYNNIIGDPQSIYATEYNDLNVLRDYYTAQYAYEMNVNEYIDVVQSIFSSVFDMARDLVPARSKLITGLVIEPHILERNKVQSKPLVKEQRDLVAEVGTVIPTIPTSSYLDHSVLIDLATIRTATASYNALESLLTASLGTLQSDYSNNSVDLLLRSQLDLTGSYQNHQTVLNLSQSVYSIVPTYTNYTDVIDVHEERTTSTETIQTAIAAGTLPSESFVVPMIPPISDIEFDFGAREYFSNVSGTVGELVYTRTRQKENVLNDLGTWAAGHVYSTNDMVVQPSTITDDRYSQGNGKEFYAVRDNFISNEPPAGDIVNWRPVTYVTAQTAQPRKAVLIGSILSLVPVTSVISPVQGYLPQHFRFHKPNYVAFMRSRYTGCVQSDETTMDGNSAVEVLPSAGDSLYVIDQNTPIAQSLNAQGPILDVR